jgi:hypothetical protein
MAAHTDALRDREPMCVRKLSMRDVSVRRGYRMALTTVYEAPANTGPAIDLTASSMLAFSWQIAPPEPLAW